MKAKKTKPEPNKPSSETKKTKSICPKNVDLHDQTRELSWCHELPFPSYRAPIMVSTHCAALTCEHIHIEDPNQETHGTQILSGWGGRIFDGMKGWMVSSYVAQCGVDSWKHLSSFWETWSFPLDVCRTIRLILGPWWLLPTTLSSPTLPDSNRFKQYAGGQNLGKRVLLVRRKVVHGHIEPCWHMQESNQLCIQITSFDGVVTVVATIRRSSW